MEIFKNHLKKYLSEEEIDKLIASFSFDAKHGVLLNLEKMDDKAFLSIFPHVTPHPIVPHAYIYDKNEYELGKSIYHELGCFYLQEPSAMIVSYLLDVKEIDYVLDLCAAPGGKTIGASLNMNQNGIIISNDINNERCRTLYDNVSRLGLKNIVITNNDFKYIHHNFRNSFDKIILDAPCSGSGMFRKDEKMKEDWSYNKVIKNALTQYEMILYAYDMLKEGGTLIYSTCSYSYEEDEEVILHLLNNTNAYVEDFDNNPLFYISKAKLGIHLFPYLFPGEGHYICKIRKPGTLTGNSFKQKQVLKNLLPNNFKNFSSYKFGENLYALPYDFSYKGINIYRFGVLVGKLIKNEIIYSYDLAHALKNYEQTVSLNEEEIQKYIKGEQINKENPYKGNILLTYKNIPLDFSKTNGHVLKNHYPKHLRKTI